MRIISGVFRGKKILQPLDNSTRPLKDLTKESILKLTHHLDKLENTYNLLYKEYTERTKIK